MVGMHLKAKLLPLKIRRNVALLKIMFGRFISLEDTVIPEKTIKRTRGSVLARLDIPFPRTEAFRRSVTYQGPARWLALPGHFKKPETIEEFSKSLRELYENDFVEDGVM